MASTNTHQPKSVAPETMRDLLLGAKASEPLGTSGSLVAGEWYVCPEFNQVFEFIVKAKGGFKEGKTVFDLDSCAPGAQDVSQPGEEYRCKVKERDYFPVDKEQFRRDLDRLSVPLANAEEESFSQTFPGLFDAIFSSSMTNSQLKDRANKQFLLGRASNKSGLVEAFLKTAAKRHINNADRKGFAAIQALGCGDVKDRLSADEGRCEREWIALLHTSFGVAMPKSVSTPEIVSPSGAEDFPRSSQAKPITSSWWSGTNPKTDHTESSLESELEEKCWDPQDLRPLFDEARVDQQVEAARRETERLQRLEQVRLQREAEEANRRETERLQRLEQVRRQREAEEARRQSERLQRLKVEEPNRKEAERFQRLEKARAQREAEQARAHKIFCERGRARLVAESDSLRRAALRRNDSKSKSSSFLHFFNHVMALVLAIVVGFLLWEFFTFSVPNFLTVDVFLHLPTLPQQQDGVSLGALGTQVVGPMTASQ